MKPNLHYVGILAAAILVLSAPATFATTTNTTQLTETTDQAGALPEDIAIVSVGEESNATVQHYTFTPQSVEINAGESVTWFSPAELVDFHTATFVLDQNLVSELLLPFAVPANTDFELLPPFNAGEPLTIPTPDGRQAILAANKVAWYPSVIDANNQITYLNGTDIEYTMDGTEKVINTGIIQPPTPPTDEVIGQNTNATDAEGEIREIPGASVTNATTTTGNATTDIQTPPTEEATAQGTEGGQPPQGPPFPLVSSFTVTFEQPGTYQYFCAIHPWMAGQVVVRGETPTETQPQPQTPTETQQQNQSETQGLGELESANPIFG
jgi:plastocyanin